MNALIVMLPGCKSESLQRVLQTRISGKQASIEQEFYEIHGTKSAERILWFITWIERRLVRNKCGRNGFAETIASLYSGTAVISL